MNIIHNTIVSFCLAMCLFIMAHASVEILAGFTRAISSHSLQIGYKLKFAM